MNAIKASDIKPGHNIVTLDDQVHRVRNISRGIFADSVMIQWAGGWACVGKDELLESPIGTEREQPQGVVKLEIGANADCAAAMT